MSNNSPVFEITFDNLDEVSELITTRAALLLENAKVAVGRTTLLGIARIANDTPVDTGRLRASIVGKYGLQASNVSGENLTLKRGAITEGKQKSRSKVDWNSLEGVIGTDVEYARHIEYGHTSSGPKSLTRKQIKFLFATGILKKGPNGAIMYTPNGTINRRAGISFRVKGRGMFRKNYENIRVYFHAQIKAAILATREGRSLAKGGSS